MKPRKWRVTVCPYDDMVYCTFRGDPHGLAVLLEWSRYNGSGPARWTLSLELPTGVDEQGVRAVALAVKIADSLLDWATVHGAPPLPTLTEHDLPCGGVRYQFDRSQYAGHKRQPAPDSAHVC